MKLYILANVLLRTKWGSAFHKNLFLLYNAAFFKERDSITKNLIIIICIFLCIHPIINLSDCAITLRKQKLRTFWNTSLQRLRHGCRFLKGVRHYLQPGGSSSERWFRLWEHQKSYQWANKTHRDPALQGICHKTNLIRKAYRRADLLYQVYQAGCDLHGR